MIYLGPLRPMSPRLVPERRSRDQYRNYIAITSTETRSPIWVPKRRSRSSTGMGGHQDSCCDPRVRVLSQEPLRSAEYAEAS
jgi:hypothetical protein